jgi:short-subunit dehydrogenase
MQSNLDRAKYMRQYGPWAVITGASDGTGAAFADQLAGLGLNLVLIARKLDALSQLAKSLEEAHGVQTRTASIDLYQPDAGAKVLAAAAGLEIGLFVSNAGADTNNSLFLDAPLSAWRDLVQRNVLAVMEATYGFAKAMRDRKRGGLIFMSSGAALGGAPRVAVYGGTKAFDMTFAEALWAELKSHGIDVITGVCPPMNTPSLERFQKEAGIQIPGILDPQDITADLIARLPDGPTRIFGYGPDAAAAPGLERARKERATSMIELVKMFAPKRHD